MCTWGWKRPAEKRKDPGLVSRETTLTQLWKQSPCEVLTLLLIILLAYWCFHECFSRSGGCLCPRECHRLRQAAADTRSVGGTGRQRHILLQLRETPPQAPETRPEGGGLPGRLGLVAPNPIGVSTEERPSSPGLGPSGGGAHCHLVSDRLRPLTRATWRSEPHGPGAPHSWAAGVQRVSADPRGVPSAAPP